MTAAKDNKIIDIPRDAEISNGSILTMMLKAAPLDAVETAKLFGNMYRDTVCYIPERKSFCIYDGARWAMDEGNVKIAALVKEFVKTTIWFCMNNNMETHLKYYQKYLSTTMRGHLITDLHDVHTKSMSDFDRAKNLLNCQNGTLNLDTGELHPHRADDFLMMLAEVEYKPGITGGRFERFVSEVMQEDRELVDHVQEMLGYCLSGYTEQECFFVLYGATTRNGKGTLNETVRAILGDYAKAANYETFQSSYYKSSGGAPSEDIARLRGARYVGISEPAEEMVLDAAKTKQLTGGDTITARFLHQNSFEFKPECKFVFNTNHLPRVTDDSIFSSDRLQVIPFSRHFESWERDLHLKETLLKPEEKSAALNWMLGGYKRLREAGRFRIPEKVQAATATCRADNDKIGEFLQEATKESPESSVPWKSFYINYSQWCSQSGYKCPGKKILKKKMDARGLMAVDSDKNNIVKGYKFVKDLSAPFA